MEVTQLNVYAVTKVGYYFVVFGIKTSIAGMKLKK
jgi:hypothetical protein